MQAPYGSDARFINRNAVRQGPAGQYVASNNQAPVEAPQEQESFDWLNAAGLGALAAGLGGLGYAAYRNRGRLMPPRDAGSRPMARPEPPVGPEPTAPRTGPAAPVADVPVTRAGASRPMADPWYETFSQRQEPSAPRPISVDEGRPSGVRTVNLNLPAGKDNSAIDRTSSSMFGGATVTAAPHVEAMESGAYQDVKREVLPGRKQQEVPRGGAEINNSTAKLNEGLEEQAQVVDAQDFVQQALLEAAQNSRLSEAAQKTNQRLSQPRGELGIKGRRALRSQPAQGGLYQQLMDLGIPEFEVKARTQAFANASDREEGLKFLNPEYNALTVGETEFANALGIVNARVNAAGNIVTGQLLNPEGDVRRSLKSAIKPRLVLKDDESLDPIAGPLGAIDGSVSATPRVQAKGGISIASDPESYELLKNERLITQRRLGEQFKLAIDEFGSSWDGLYQQSQQDPSIPIKAPRREARVIDAYDLEIPTRILYDEAGEPIGSELYKDLLGPEIVERVLKGEQVLVEDVPFMVNKARAIADAEAFGQQMPELQQKAEDYRQTGQALARLYEQKVKPLEASKTVQSDMGITEEYNPSTKLFEQEFKSGAFYSPGEYEITPTYGEGAQKGGLVGGTPERRIAEKVYRLAYAPSKKLNASGKPFLNTKGYAVDAEGTPSVERNITLNDLDIKRLDTGVPLYEVEIPITNDAVTTQPMRVLRFLNRAETTEISNQTRRAKREIQDLVKRNIIPSEKAKGINDFINMQSGVETGEINPVSEAARQAGIPVPSKGITAIGSVKRKEKATGRPFDTNVYETVEETVQAPLEIKDLDGNTIFREGNIPKNQIFDLLSKARRTVEGEGIVKGRYARIAEELQKELETSQGIRLPVLDSPTAYDFIQSLDGIPKSTISRRVLATSGKDGGAFPLSDKELQKAQDLGTISSIYGRAKQNAPYLSRGLTGTTPLDNTSSSKEESIYEQVGSGVDDFIEKKNYGDNDQKVAYYGNVELGRARSPEQTRIDARLTGPKKPIDTVPLTNAEQKFLDEYTGGSSREPENIYANEVGSGSLSAADIAEINRGQNQGDRATATPRVQSSAALKSDPMKNLMFRDLSPAAVRAIQRTPSAAMQQREMNLNELLETAAQTPGGNMPLSTVELPAGIAVSQGPRQISGTKTLNQYGLTPAQLQAVANTTMSRARQNQAQSNQNQQALRRLTTQQLELLNRTPRATNRTSVNPMFKVTPEQQEYMRALVASSQTPRVVEQLGGSGIGQLRLSI
jgi:hypothetical protein